MEIQTTITFRNELSVFVAEDRNRHGTLSAGLRAMERRMAGNLASEPCNFVCGMRLMTGSDRIPSEIFVLVQKTML